MLHGAWKREFGCAVQCYPEVIYPSCQEEELKRKCILKFKHGFSTGSSIRSTLHSGAPSVRKLSRGTMVGLPSDPFQLSHQTFKRYFLICVGFSNKLEENSTQICSGPSLYWSSTMFVAKSTVTGYARSYTGEGG